MSLLAHAPWRLYSTFNHSAPAFPRGLKFFLTWPCFRIKKSTGSEKKNPDSGNPGSVWTGPMSSSIDHHIWRCHGVGHLLTASLRVFPAMEGSRDLNFKDGRQQYYSEWVKTLKEIRCNQQRESERKKIRFIFLEHAVKITSIILVTLYHTGSSGKNVIVNLLNIIACKNCYLIFLE